MQSYPMTSGASATWTTFIVFFVILELDTQDHTHLYTLTKNNFKKFCVWKQVLQKKLVQVGNDVRVNKWWQDLNFWMNYFCKLDITPCSVSAEKVWFNLV